jgi:hypothetical protein
LLGDTKEIFQKDAGSALVSAIRGLPSQASGDDLLAAVDTFTAKECASNGETPWLMLARLTLTVDATGTLVDVAFAPSKPLGPTRLSILPSTALQALGLLLTGTAIGTGTVSRGPVAGAVRFDASGASPKFTIPISTDGLVTVPVSTFAASMVSLEHLNAQYAWDDVAINASMEPMAALGSVAIVATCAPQALGAGIYRLAINSPPNKPIADSFGRALSPWPYARTLKLVADANGVLQLDPTF